MLSLTIHFIDAPKDQPTEWVLKSQLLALERVVGDHSGANTAAQLIALYKKYGILGKVCLPLRLKIMSYCCSSAGTLSTMCPQMTPRCKRSASRPTRNRIPRSDADGTSTDAVLYMSDAELTAVPSIRFTLQRIIL